MRFTLFSTPYGGDILQVDGQLDKVRQIGCCRRKEAHLSRSFRFAAGSAQLIWMRTLSRYDRRGNLINTSARALPHPDYDNAIDYSYNADDQLTGIYFAFYRDVQYRYDTTGQVSKIWVHDIDDGDFSGVGYNVTRTLADHIKHLPFGPIKSLTYGNGLALNRQPA